MDTKHKDSRVRRVCIQWSADDMQRLIKAVEEAECLWNVYDVEYKNRTFKEASWSKIAKQLSVTNKDALDKWNSLRNTYRTALKTHLQKTKSGGKAKKPSFPYYKAMSFLQPLMMLKLKSHSDSWEATYSQDSMQHSSTSNPSDDLEFEEPEPSFADTSSIKTPKRHRNEELEFVELADAFPRTASTPTPKRRRNDAQNHALLESESDAMSVSAKTERDFWTSYGDFIASNGRKLETDHPDLAVELQIETNGILQKIQRKVLARLRRRGAEAMHGVGQGDVAVKLEDDETAEVDITL